MVLAIEGGEPVRRSMLPYGRQSVDQADIDAVVEVLRSSWLTTGPNVAHFEQAFAGTTGAAFATAVSNGTAALHAAAFAAGIAPGDEVIVPALTFAATANCVLYQGGTVVFADVRPDTLNIDPVAVRRLITKRTKAIIAVDYAGQPCSIAEIRDIAREQSLSFIEDAAHALGATYRGEPVGSLADLTTFSLHPVKHITTGEGGVVTTNDETLAAKLRLFRNHGITSDHREREAAGSWVYEMVALGYNYRLTDFQSALGESQLGKLGQWLARRRQIAARYAAAFRSVPQIELPAVQPDCEPAWHLYPIRLRIELLRGGRGDVYRALRAEGIGVNVHYLPVYWHPYYENLGYRRGLCPVAESAYERLLSLPMFAAMTDQDVADVITAVEKVVNSYRKDR